MREDVGVNHVELSLNLVAADVVDRAGVFVDDQVFCRGRKPAVGGGGVSGGKPPQRCRWRREGTSPSSPCMAPWLGPTPGSCGRPAPGAPPSDTWGVRSRSHTSSANTPPPPERLPAQLLVLAHALDKLLRRTLDDDEHRSGVGGGADLLGADLRDGGDESADGRGGGGARQSEGHLFPSVRHTATVLQGCDERSDGRGAPGGEGGGGQNGGVNVDSSIS